MFNTVPSERHKWKACFSEEDFNCDTHQVNSIVIRSFRSDAWGKFKVTCPWADNLWAIEWPEEDRTLISRRMSQVLRHARGNDRHKCDNGGWFHVETIVNAIDWRRIKRVEGVFGKTEAEEIRAGRVMHQVILQALIPHARAHGSAAKVRFQ
jgi:hypothetical protein